MIDFCCHRRKLGHDRNRRRTKISQVKHVTTKISMPRQTAQQAIRIKEENFVATKEIPVVTEIAKDSKKFCHDGENSIMTKLTG